MEKKAKAEQENANGKKAKAEQGNANGEKDAAEKNVDKLYSAEKNKDNPFFTTDVDKFRTGITKDAQADEQEKAEKEGGNDFLPTRGNHWTR